MKSKKKMTNDELETVIGAAVTEARAGNNDAVQDDRIKAQKYYDGYVSIGHEEGRSKVVSTKCRDVVRQVKPSLLRVFLNSDNPVEFIPRKPQDVQAAEQATTYIQWKFYQQNGYRVLSDVFHDALVKKVGIAKAYFEEGEDTETFEASGLSDMEFTALGQSPDVEFIEHSQTEDGLHDVKISVTKESGDIRVISIPPEDFFIDDGATSIDDFTVCGNETEMPIADLVEMGIPYEDVEGLTGRGIGDDEETMQRQGYTDTDEITVDPMMRKVMVTEAYMRADVEGNGKPQLYSFLLGGEEYKILRKDPVDRVPYAIFEIDPQPHTFYGDSLVELVMDDQDVATSLIRGVLDNVALTNNPGMTVIEGQANMDDLLNNEIGAIRRITQAGAITPDVVPFVAGQTLPALAYHDQMIENKTGVSRASLGLDPDALQNATATAVQATVNGGNGQTEVMARNLAEGVKRLFQLMLHLTHDHFPEDDIAQLGENPIPPSEWDAEMDMTINVGLGSGQEDAKMAVLQMTFQTQQVIWTNFGPNNGLVTMTGMRNTLADMLALGGVRNADRYYQPMTPEREQQLMQQAAQAAAQQPQQPDPNAAFLQSEQMKVQQKNQEAQMKTQVEVQKAKAKDDLDRDQMLQDGVLKAADLVGKYGVGPDLLALYRQQQNN